MGDQVRPSLLRMREGKEGGGKGPLITEDMSLTLTGVQDVLFQPAAGPTPLSSAVSEGSISDSNMPDGRPFPSARSNATPPSSSQSGGPESPTSETYPSMWVTSGEEMIDGSGYHREKISTDVTPTLNGYSTPLVGMSISENQRGEVNLTEYSRQITTGGGKPGQGYPAVLQTPSSGRADSHVKTSRSPDDDEDWPEPEADSPSHSLTFWTDTEMSPNDGSFSKTFKGFSLHMGEEIWRRSSVRWGTSGMGGPIDAWTGATSMCRSAGSVCSSSHTRLQDILISEAPARFLLSGRAAAGILRRASKRGRRLPPVLEEALLALTGTESQQTEPSPPGPSPQQPDTTDMPSAHKTQMGDFFKWEMENDPPMPSQPSGDTAVDQPVTNTTTSSTVRRLTPLETELLMGWPPGHTISRAYSRRGSTVTDSGPAGTGSSPERQSGLETD